MVAFCDVYAGGGCEAGGASGVEDGCVDVADYVSVEFGHEVGVLGLYGVDALTEFFDGRGVVFEGDSCVLDIM